MYIQRLQLRGGAYQKLNDGATEIVLIGCHSPHLYQPEGINARNLITLIDIFAEGVNKTL